MNIMVRSMYLTFILVPLPVQPPSFPITIQRGVTAGLAAITHVKQYIVKR